MKPNQSSSWNTFVQQFLNDYLGYRPDVAVNAGRHEFDGRLPDSTRNGLGEFTGFLKRTRAAAQQQTGLTEREALEREYLTTQINRSVLDRGRRGPVHQSVLRLELRRR